LGIYEFIDNKRTLWIIIGLVVILVVITIITIGTPRQVVVQGKIWEWVDAPEGETGTIHVWERPSGEAENWTPPPGTEMRPLSGAEIRYTATYRDRQEERAFALSNKEGRFSKNTRDWKVTGDIEIYMTVAKEGYHTVNATFVNKGEPNVVNVVLTRMR
jgi:hypothetical protein